MKHNLQKRSTKEAPLETVSKNGFTGGLKTSCTVPTPYLNSGVDQDT